MPHLTSSSPHSNPAPAAIASPRDQRRVLSTLNADGSRRWLRPRLSRGRFFRARAVTAYTLIALYALLPFVRINGRPALMLDVLNRKFHVLGATFLSTDTLLTAVLAIAIGLGVFLATALFGRVWCGWACPQTVYLEFVYRPIERFLAGRDGKVRGWRQAAKYAAYSLVSLHLANVFLAYFVGVDSVSKWTLGSPFNHPAAFVLVLAVTALMMFDFCFFREQTCIVACPYGRLQSALLDRHSLIITYDRARGEPRRPLKTKPGDVALRQLARGDCINCSKCVTTCPTGIDIRDGLQMECIGCAQCIDACDDVMTRIGKPRGLIRYSSQAMVEGKAQSLVRARTIIYPLLLAGALTAFIALLLTRSPFDVEVLPRQAAPFYELPGGDIANQLRLSLANRTDGPATYSLAVVSPAAAHFEGDAAEVTLAGQESRIIGLVVAVPASALDQRGACNLTLRISQTNGASRDLPFHMLGPARPTRRPEDGGRP